jgi:GntR family transcriptional regulator of vanillate catabolism
MKSDDKSNHTKRAAADLRQWIISGEVAGGSRLREIAVAEKLNISRTPVREAMARLAEEGLLERVGTGGFVVRAFTLRDAVDAIELRGILEGTAARMAAEEGAAPERIAAIRETLAQLDSCFGKGGYAVDFECYSELNTVFHDQLAGLCASAIIRRELERVKSLPFASPSAFVLDRPDERMSQTSLIVAQDQHRALVEAIEAREGARAEAIAREHARTARANLLATTGSSATNGAALTGISLISA